MSNHNSNYAQTQPKLKRLELKSSIPIIVPKDVLDKIKYLCMKMESVEWSGVLFYEVRGSIRNSSKMKIVLKDILLMDKGLKAHTKFDWDEDVVDYRMSNPQSFEWLVGMIHSHNTMRVFFSGEDMDELNDNCTQHNFYLSVIVNNYTEMIGKIAFTAETRTFMCKDEKGLDYSMEIVGGNIEPYMFVYTCEPQLKKPKIVVSDSFDERISTIESKSKKRDEEEARKRAVDTNKNTATGGTKPAPAIEKNMNTGKDIEKWARPPVDDYWGGSWGEEWDNYTIDESEESQFLAFMLRLGKREVDDEVESALEDLESANVNWASAMKVVSNNYSTFYGEYFKDKSSVHYGNVLTACIKKLREYTTKFPMVSTLIDDLAQMAVDISLSNMNKTISNGNKSTI